MMQGFPMATDKPHKNKTASPNVAVWAITPNGLSLGHKICEGMGGARLFVSEKLQNKFQPDLGANPNAGNLAAMGCDQIKDVSSFNRLAEELSVQFFKFSAHIFIFATGIAVRMIAPLIQSKTTDPAVIVLDDKGVHAISLLSGHLGGANRLTQRIASLVNASPVITTATDINGLPSIDLIAQQNNLYIENPEAIKNINMVFLKKETMSVYDPEGYINDQIPEAFIHNSSVPTQGAGVVCTWKTIKVPRETIILRPQTLSVGIGCNRNTPINVIHEFLRSVLNEEGISLNSVFTLATTDVKLDEVGLLELADKLDLPIKFYDKTQLNSVDTIETPSKMVEKHLGVKSVCEAAAILAAERGRLIVTKKKNKDVTIAVALKQ